MSKLSHSTHTPSHYDAQSHSFLGAGGLTSFHAPPERMVTSSRVRLSDAGAAAPQFPAARRDGGV